MEQKLVVLATVVLPSLLLRVSVGVYKNILCVIVYILLIKKPTTKMATNHRVLYSCD